MKRILFLVLLFVSSLCFSQTKIFRTNIDVRGQVNAKDSIVTPLIRFSDGSRQSKSAVTSINVADSLKNDVTDSLIINANALVVKTTGDVGVGTQTIRNKFHVLGGGLFSLRNTPNETGLTVIPNILNLVSPTNILASSTGVETVLRLSRDGLAGNKFNQIADFAVGTYATGINGLAELRLTMNNGGTHIPDTEVMRWQANGNIAIGSVVPDSRLHIHNASAGTVSPVSNTFLTLENNDNCFLSLLTPAIEVSGMFFGHPSSSADGGILYNQTPVINGFTFRTNGNIDRAVLDSSGNFGIGETLPLAKLHVKSAESGVTPGGQADDLFIEGTGNTGLTIATDNTSFGTLYFADPQASASHGFDFNHSSNVLRLLANGAKVFIDGATGNIGFGESSPNGELQFSSTLNSRRIVLFETANNDHQYYGFGINASTLRFQVDGTTSSHKFFAATSTSASNLLCEIKGTGRLEVAERIKIAGGSPAQGKTLTSDANGLASWEVPPHGTNTQSTSSVALGTSFSNLTGATITLPSAGTYRVWYHIRGSVNAGLKFVTGRLFNQTTSVAVANTEAIAFFRSQAGNFNFQATASMEAYITVTGATVINLQAKSSSATGSTTVNNDDGRTIIGFNRL